MVKVSSAIDRLADLHITLSEIVIAHLQRTDSPSHKRDRATSFKEEHDDDTPADKKPKAAAMHSIKQEPVP
jgi:hypothetical protein